MEFMEPIDFWISSYSTSRGIFTFRSKVYDFDWLDLNIEI